MCITCGKPVESCGIKSGKCKKSFILCGFGGCGKPKEDFMTKKLDERGVFLYN
jgi:hypothetical protein